MAFELTMSSTGFGLCVGFHFMTALAHTSWGLHTTTNPRRPFAKDATLRPKPICASTTTSRLLLHESGCVCVCVCKVTRSHNVFNIAGQPIWATLTPFHFSSIHIHLGAINTPSHCRTLLPMAFRTLFFFLSPPQSRGGNEMANDIVIALYEQEQMAIWTIRPMCEKYL